jgi:hypothetical protein
MFVASMKEITDDSKLDNRPYWQNASDTPHGVSCSTCGGDLHKDGGI